MRMELMRSRLVERGRGRWWRKEPERPPGDIVMEEGPAADKKEEENSLIPLFLLYDLVCM